MARVSVWLMTVAAVAVIFSAMEARSAPEGICGLLSVDEVGAALGARVRPGTPTTPLDSACQWLGAVDHNATLQAGVIGQRSAWAPPTGKAGFKAAPGIGLDAYVAPAKGGWTAGALTKTHVVQMSAIGGGASADSVLTALKLLTSRLKEH